MTEPEVHSNQQLAQLWRHGQMFTTSKMLS